jgi:hypothetical protein
MIADASTPTNIAEDLHSLARPLSDLHLLDRNPRRGDVEAVARSYERFGQRKPIVARRDGTIIAGNHQYQAAQRLGWSHIAVVTVDDNDAEATAFALADNRIAELGDYDNVILGQLIAEVREFDHDLFTATGWAATEEILGSEFFADADPIDPSTVDVDALEAELEHTCPACHFRW